MCVRSVASRRFRLLRTDGKYPSGGCWVFHPVCPTGIRYSRAWLAGVVNSGVGFCLRVPVSQVGWCWARRELCRCSAAPGVFCLGLGRGRARAPGEGKSNGLHHGFVLGGGRLLGRGIFKVREWSHFKRVRPRRGGGCETLLDALDGRRLLRSGSCKPGGGLGWSFRLKAGCDVVLVLP